MPRLLLATVLAVGCLLLLPLTAEAVEAGTITPTTNAADMVTALDPASGVVTGASFVTTPPNGTPNAVATQPLDGFPLTGGSYAILTNGDATQAPGAPADDPQQNFASAGDGGGHVRGNADANENDVSILKVDLNVPADANCLTFGFRFLSEEYPDFVGSSVNDSFIAELDTDDWSTASDGTVTAPHNFAFDAGGNPVTVNTAGITAGDAAGTTYGGATAPLQASTPITPGAHSLYLSIFDQGDDIYDSAAFLDSLVVGEKTAGQCEAGAHDAPLVTLDQPPNGATINDSSPTLSGQGGTAPGDDPSVTVNVYAGTSATGTPVQTQATTVESGTWSIGLDPLPDGVYTAQATQSDSDGNVGTSTANTFTIDTSGADTTAPIVALEQPADGATVTDATPDISGTGGTAPGDDSDVTARIYSGSSVAGTPEQTQTATVASDGSWATSASVLADGTYTVQVEQDDAAGNQGFSDPHTFTVDTSPPDTTSPAVSLVRPANGATLTTATPLLSGGGGRATGDDAHVTVRVYRGTRAAGTAVQARTVPLGATGTWSMTAAALPDGTYTAQAEQDDAAGNQGLSDTHTFKIDTSGSDHTAPVVTIDEPVGGASLTDTTPRIAGDAGTTTGDEDHVSVQLYRGPHATGTSTWSGTATVSGGRWAIDTSTLAYGQYTVQATQRDAAGNTGTTEPVTFTVDPPAGADLEVTVTPTLPIVVGKPTRYTITVHNHGPADATGVRMAALLPAGADLPSHEEFAPSTPGCSRSDRLMSCFAGFLRSGETLTYRFVLTPRRSGSMDVKATATAAQGDPAQSSNTQTADATAVLPPILAKNIITARVSGTVRIKRPGAKHFRTLHTEALLPVGSLVDATHGRVRLTSRRSPGGPTQTADFYQGEFRLRQIKANHGLTLLDLRGGSFAGCPRSAAQSTGAHVARRRHRRSLWGSGHGSFRTRGRYGSATVRGTIWFTQDRCNGTFFKTNRGVVAVRNYVKHKTVKVPAGHTYLARAAKTH